ncbi:hypothetical protein [Kineosporia babensis]|uniref:Uncharacterized protein n=1 Tax=Kineosporia babensis TaxID=499548 RepID=A0A9X1SWB4_9ACTN|nr:hypothetical protein [Kineosporia babensis]MCD5313780.1 hypothetical protein [Kineosporia babensis]
MNDEPLPKEPPAPLEPGSYQARPQPTTQISLGARLWALAILIVLTVPGAPMAFLFVAVEWHPCGSPWAWLCGNDSVIPLTLMPLAAGALGIWLGVIAALLPSRRGLLFGVAYLIAITGSLLPLIVIGFPA